MKKLKALSLAVGLSTAALSISATTATAADQVRMATIAPGTSAYQVMSTMASMVNRADVGLDVTVDSTGAAAKHMIELAKGNLDFAMSAPELYGFLVDGKLMYSKVKNANELSQNLGLVFWFPYGAFHAVTYADSGINTLDDLKGKKVFLGPPGGGAQATSNQWIEGITGYKANEDYESVKASWGAALQGFQDRQFDVYITGGIPPFPQVEQLALTSELRLLGLTKEEVDNASEAMLKSTTLRGRFLDMIPEGIYDNVASNGDVYTVAATVGVVTRMDLDEDTVYKMTKAFWDNIDEEAKTSPLLERVTIERAFSADNIKVHPGALKYYKEAGIAVPAAMQ